MKQFYVYILNSASGTLYTGVTNDLMRRVQEHKHGLHEGFTKKYNVNRLAYYEVAPDAKSAIAREKQIKGYARAKKLALIKGMNSTWRDLSDEFLAAGEAHAGPTSQGFLPMVGMTELPGRDCVIPSDSEESLITDSTLTKQKDARVKTQSNMNYLICENDNDVSFKQAPLPQPAAGELVVRMTACGVCATDTLKIYGNGYAKPQKLGHEIVGVVYALGDGVTQFAIGQRVGMAHHTPDYASHYSRRGSETMDPTFKKTNVTPGGFSEYILVPALNVQHLVVPVPDGVPDLRAIFMEPLACCLRGLDRVNLAEGDSALIIGAGAIGMLFVPLLSDRAVTTLVADVRE